MEEMGAAHSVRSAAIHCEATAEAQRIGSWHVHYTLLRQRKGSWPTGREGVVIARESVASMHACMTRGGGGAHTEHLSLTLR
jgi:hypothetical protein